MSVLSKGPYSRIYHSIVDDPMMEKVYGNDRALATWLRMLLVADAFWPNSAPMTHRNPTVRLLIAVGLVIERSGNRYTMRGLEAERERRSASARNAAAVRWQSGGNAHAMPRRDETRIEEKTGSHANGVPARSAAVAANGTGPSPKPGEHVGQHPGCIVCAGMRGVGAVDQQMAAEWVKCASCGVRKGEHVDADAGHEFSARKTTASMKDRDQ